MNMAIICITTIVSLIITLGCSLGLLNSYCLWFPNRKPTMIKSLIVVVTFTYGITGWIVYSVWIARGMSL